MLVRFLTDRTVKDGSGRSYAAGQIVDLPADSAQHWLRRRVAVALTEAEIKAAEREAARALIAAKPKLE